MKILVTRHGQTDWNILRKLQGQTDIELNDTGRKQAEETGKRIKDEKIDLIITSPLKRATETARIINKSVNANVIEDTRLAERMFGNNEGLTIDELHKLKETNQEANYIWDYQKNINFNNIEPVHDFFERVYNLLDEIKEKYNDKTILLVGHGGTSVPINCYFERIPLEQFSNRKDVKKLDNCEVWKFTI